MLTFFSSFGQTFLISLYVPHLLEAFDMSNSFFGSLYAAATVLSSVFLVYVGKLIDTYNLRNYTLASAFLLLSACLLIAFSFNTAMVFAGIFALRLGGQGLLGHIAGTTASRYFDGERGRALGLTSLGFSFGEGFFPLLVSFVILSIGWRESMAVNGMMVLFVLIPFVWFILRGFSNGFETENNNGNKEPFSRIQLLKTKDFYILAFNSAIVPFVITGLFFYQVFLAESKGWSVELIASAFIGFAVGRTASVIISGGLIDRFSGLRLLPFYLLFLAGALLLLMVTDAAFAAFIYLTLAGLAVGSGMTVKNAAVAELYGVANLGSIRSLFTTIMVFSTALSPVLFGFILDQGAGFFVILAGSLILAITASLLSIKLAFRN